MHHYHVVHHLLLRGDLGSRRRRPRLPLESVQACAVVPCRRYPGRSSCHCHNILSCLVFTLHNLLDTAAAEAGRQAASQPASETLPVILPFKRRRRIVEALSVRPHHRRPSCSAGCLVFLVDGIHSPGVHDALRRMAFPSVVAATTLQRG